VTAARQVAPGTESELDERLSRPTRQVLETFERHPGDVIVLGAAGKMGPSLARMARRALDDLGRQERVLAASRFSDPAVETGLHAHGVETVKCDLGNRADVMALPEVPNVIFMAGQKFGTSVEPSATWAANVLVPALAAERYAHSRIVAFSTGNVYPLVPRESGGACEDDTPAPVGEYATSCLGRERILEHFSRERGTAVAIVRLNYAVDLRYGVLVDLAQRVRDEEPIDLAMGSVNVIWQGDASAQALCCLAQASSPPFVVNVTGPETLSIRAVATRFGELLGRAPVFGGTEAPDALLSDASRASALFGAPTVDADTLIDWVADWIARDGRTLAKPTKFEVRDGRF
jgi:nucleoside-diphosphate-sugar epimerase